MICKVIINGLSMNVIPFVKAAGDLPDPRDNRGKRHDLAFILTAVVLAIMAGRSKLSSMHRYICNKIDWLREITELPEAIIISRAHLPRLLNRVDWESLNEMIQTHFGFTISCNSDDEWVAIDGKTLRGTTNASDKQGEKIVLAVTHKTRRNLAQCSMRGPKSGEVSVVRQMLQQTGLQMAKVTLDALHCTPTTTAQINQAGGVYLTQVKENQEILLNQVQQLSQNALPLGIELDKEKSHGRVTERSAKFFTLTDSKFHKRWEKSSLQTLIVINRNTFEKAKQKTTQETSYYVTNQVVAKSKGDSQKEVFNAIREHWGVESDNWIRDVTLGEDKVKTTSGNLAQVLATLRTLTMRLFRKGNVQNFQESIENFTDSQSVFEAFLLKVGFL